MVTRHAVVLTADERQQCAAVLQNGAETSRARRRAAILLLADRGSGCIKSDEEVAAGAGADARTVARVRSSYCHDGFQAALHGHPRPLRTAAKLSDSQELALIGLLQTAPPLGFPRWTVRTLAARMREIPNMPPVSRELVRRTLLRHHASPTPAAMVEQAGPRPA